MQTSIFESLAKVPKSLHYFSAIWDLREIHGTALESHGALEGELRGMASRADCSPRQEKNVIGEQGSGVVKSEVYARLGTA